MALLDLLVAVALLLWGSRQLHRGASGLAAPWSEALLLHARHGRCAALGTGVVAGLLHPAEADRVKWLGGHAATGAWPPARAFILLLGVHFGAAAAMLLLVAAPPWSFHVLTVAGAAASLLAREGRWRLAGRALFGTGLLLLALRMLAFATQADAQAPLGAAIAQGLEQDALLSVTAGALLVLGLRSVFPAVLLVAVTWTAWLTPAAAVGLLLGVQLGGAIAGCAAAATDVAARRLGAAHLVATLLAGAAFLLLRADFAWLLAGTGGDGLVWLHAGFHGAVAAAFLHLAEPLMRAVGRWLPATGEPADAAAPHAAQLHARELETPSVALGSALREAMRVADLVDGMLRLVKDVFLHGDPVAVQSVREAERRVDGLYLALKQYLARIARRPLGPDEHLRWEETMTFLIAAEQVADRVHRMLGDLESGKIAARLAYPADAQAEVLALHGQLAANLRLAAGVCLERRLQAARELAASRQAFRELERSFRAAHVARLVAGEGASVAISSLHLDLLADLVDMNDQLCAFARRFVELRAERGPVPAGGDRITGSPSELPFHRGAMPQERP